MTLVCILCYNIAMQSPSTNFRRGQDQSEVAEQAFIDSSLSDVYVKMQLGQIASQDMEQVIHAGDLREKHAASRTRELEDRVNRDALTRLLDRNGLLDAYGNRLEPNGSLLLIDLDGFKDVNDGEGGHPLGDQLLRGIGQLMKSFRPDDPIARLGGDEFAVMMEGASETDALNRATELCEIIGGIETVDGMPVNVGASIGVADYNGVMPFDDVYRNADLAVYRAKDNGRGQAVAYSILDHPS